MNPYEIYEIDQNIMQVEEMLAAGEIDELTAAGTLESLTMDRIEQYENICKLIRNDEAVANMLDEEAKRISGKSAAAKARIKWYKGYMQQSMASHGERKLEAGTFTVSVQKNGGKAPIVVEAAVEDIPQEYRKVSYVADNDKIRAALDAGEKLPFAHLGERGESLRIK